MSPNNYSVTETTTASDEQESFKMEQSEMKLLNVSCSRTNVSCSTASSNTFQRKNKNILNSDESFKDLNGNVVEAKTDEPKDEPQEYKIEYAWFNIFGFIYLHWCLLSAGTIVGWNKTLAFGKQTAA